MEATVAAQGIKNSTTYDASSKENVKFTTSTELTNISISKEVTGNMGDRNKTFTLTVNITGENGETYAVTGGAGNPATVTANTNTTLYIKNGETITIGSSSGVNQIAVGTSYTIAETAVTNYTTTIDGSERTNNSITKTTVATPANNLTEIVNDYNLPPLSGVFFNIMPYVAIAAVVLFLFIILKRNSKKREE